LKYFFRNYCIVPFFCHSFFLSFLLSTMSMIIDLPDTPPMEHRKLAPDFWNIPMDKQWGDLVPASETSDDKSVGWSVNSTPESDALEGWFAPALRLRKDIWENFPVTLQALPDEDGTDRYAILWNQRNLVAWRDERSTSNAEWLDYEDYCYYRLMHALHMNARYEVEPARSDEQICVIAMVHSGKSETSSVVSSVSSTGQALAQVQAPVQAPVQAQAPLRSLKAIANAFPVCWEQDGNVLAMKFHNKKLRDSGESPALVRDRLIQALKQSPAGVYSPSSRKDVLCVFTLN